MSHRGLRIDLAAALFGFVYFFAGAGFPWHFATVAGLAVGVASFTTRRTLRQLRGLHSPPESGGAPEVDAAESDAADSDVAKSESASSSSDAAGS